MRYDVYRYNCRRMLCGIFIAAAILSATGFVLPVLADDGLAELQVEYSPGEITLLSEEARETANESLNAIVAIPADERTFKNTVVAFDTVLSDYSDAVLTLDLMGYVATDPDIAAEGMESESAYSTFLVRIFTRSDLYDAMVSVEDQVPDTPVEQRLYEYIIDEFEHNGLGLSEETLSEVRKMNAELSDLESEFNSNLNSDNSTIVFTEEELKGVSSSDLESFSRTEDGDNIIELNSADYENVMTYADDENTRMLTYKAYSNIQAEANTALLEEAIVLREEIAEKMGYATWADYVLTNRMAKNTSNVMEFLNSMKEPLSEKTEEEMAVLLEIKQEIDPSATEVRPWDIRYLENLLLMQDYDFDSEEFKEYFPLENVLEGVFATCGDLFAVEFNEVYDAPVWSSDVRAFEVINSTDNRTLGYLYFDPYPRDGKYKSYFLAQMIGGREINGTYKQPVVCIVGNFESPEGDMPPLLSLYDVSTLFHETGHAMHVLLTDSPYGLISGYNAAWDFCETPSQTLEEWAYDPDVLIPMSGRYDNSSEKIPEDLAERAIAASKVDSGYDYGSQLLYSLVDMYYHNATGPVNTSEVWQDTYEEILGLDFPEDIHPAAGFSHIMGGYDAGYYGYLWSKVYALNIVDEFKEKGMANETLGLKLRDDVYSKGNTADGMTLLYNFLGHEPGIDSLYSYIGMNVSNVSNESAAA